MPVIKLIVIVLFLLLCLWATAKYATGIFRIICFGIIIAGFLYVLLTLLGVWGNIASIHV